MTEVGACRTAKKAAPASSAQNARRGRAARLSRYAEALFVSASWFARHKGNLAGIELIDELGWSSIMS